MATWRAACRELTELLVGDRPVDDLLETIVPAVHDGLRRPRRVAARPRGGPPARRGLRRRSADRRGAAPTRRAARASPSASAPAPARRANCARSPSSPRAAPVGILALRGLPTSDTDRAVLNTFANDAALALERAQLREQALRSHLLEEVDRFRQGLMGAVSPRPAHAAGHHQGGVLDPVEPRRTSLDVDQTHELYRLIEVESRPPDAPGLEPARHDPHRGGRLHRSPRARRPCPARPRGGQRPESDHRRPPRRRRRCPRASPRSTSTPY